MFDEVDIFPRDRSRGKIAQRPNTTYQKPPASADLFLGQPALDPEPEAVVEVEDGEGHE